MKVGNIVSTTNIKVSEEFNVVKSIDDIIVGLPTLIVGWEYVHKNYPKYDITDREISPNLYWTFKITEKRDKHESDIQWFVNKSYSDLVSNITYVFVDPIQYNNREIRKLIRKIKSLKNPISYVNGEMIYIYGENFIFGVDLKLLKYLSINTEKIKNKIKNLSVFSLENGVKIQKYDNFINGLKNEKKYIPFLFSIDSLS